MKYYQKGSGSTLTENQFEEHMREMGRRAREGVLAEAFDVGGQPYVDKVKMELSKLRFRMM